MFNYVNCKTEEELENIFIEQLKTINYDRIEITTEQDLLENFRLKISEFNKDILNNEILTKKEFHFLMIEMTKEVGECYSTLRDTINLERENGDKVQIRFIDFKNLSKNSFQVTNQITVKTEYTSRYDVTLLINGIPFVQVELKNPNVSMYKAFNQINRYNKESYNGLFKYIQLFIISNGVDTKYFSNVLKTDFNFNFTFYWSNEKNEKITNLNDFTYAFLNQDNLLEIMNKFMIKTEDKIIVMRPYQIYATKKIIERVKEIKEKVNKDENDEKGGFIWHTTGSGKTITSWKTADLLSIGDNKKIFFVVDRKDLDSQTIKEFALFSKVKEDDIRSKNTYSLIKNIEDKDFIITTIQKLANAIPNKDSKPNDYYLSVLNKIKDENVVFIFDECHRSQFGEMHSKIKNFFTNAIYFGFTGTPIKEENKSPEDKTTAAIFGECLHTYLIKDAISDGNVLGFNVEYIKTFDYDNDNNSEEKVEKINKTEVFESQERLDLVVQHILKNHNSKTKNRRYTSLFTISNTNMLIKYYDTFKKYNKDLNIVAIFSLDANAESEGKETKKQSLSRIMNDYSELFNMDKYTNDSKSRLAYTKNVTKRIKGNENKKEQIDILLVVDMFTTGFDAPKLNTLYVDKNLEWHGLLQAFSRTNRVEQGYKEVGNIVCYRNLKSNVDNAIKLFSCTDDTNIVLMKSKDEYLDIFKKQLVELLKLTPTYESVNELKSEKQKQSFVSQFKKLNKVLNLLNNFSDFNFDELGIPQDTYKGYLGKYLNLAEEVEYCQSKGVSILEDVKFEIELMEVDIINVDYILNLLKNISKDDKEKRHKDISNILKVLEDTYDPVLRNKTTLIKQFIEEMIIKKQVDTNDNVDITNELDTYIKTLKEQEIDDFSKDNDIDVSLLTTIIKKQENINVLKEEDVESLVKDKKIGFMQKFSLKEVIKDFVKNHVDKFKE